MTVIPLTAFDLSLVALLILGIAWSSYRMRLGLEKQLIVAAVRTTLQLLLVGFILRAIFAHVHIAWVTLVSLVMLGAASLEIVARQHRKLKGWWSYGVGASSMFVSSFAITVITLAAVIGAKPWYTPQYAIPLLGMLLGNTMNGISLGVDRLTNSAWQQRAIIEQRLLLGQDWHQAILDIRRDCMRTGMIPMINAMAAAGLVSLPGMMTGQILAGSPPIEAVKYQIMIMFLITGGTGFGIIAALSMTARRLFDKRHRLRLDSLQSGRDSS